MDTQQQRRENYLIMNPYLEATEIHTHLLHINNKNVTSSLN